MIAGLAPEKQNLKIKLKKTYKMETKHFRRSK
jgi:hypothetical protein